MWRKNSCICRNAFSWTENPAKLKGTHHQWAGGWLGWWPQTLQVLLECLSLLESRLPKPQQANVLCHSLAGKPNKWLLHRCPLSSPGKWRYEKANTCWVFTIYKTSSNTLVLMTILQSTNYDQFSSYSWENQGHRNIQWVNGRIGVWTPQQLWPPTCASPGVSQFPCVQTSNGQGQAHDKCYPLSPTHFLSSVRFHYGSQFVLVWLQEAKGTWFGVVNDKGSGGTSISTWPHPPWGQSSCLFSQIRFWALSRFTAGQNCDIILSPNSA